ncbi:MAG: hypothetical protein QGG42_08000 [Phycisphaerae bacterium]|jgi:hypothetical protein|nr:hypothetical protein [Phycisphaerae bacterium]
MKNLGARIALIGLIIGGVVAYRVFFVDSDEVGSFNDDLVDVISASDKSYQTFTGLLDDYCEGRTVNIQAMRVEQDRLNRKVQRDVDRIRKISVPDDELCKSFIRIAWRTSTTR